MKIRRKPGAIRNVLIISIFLFPMRSFAALGKFLLGQNGRPLPIGAVRFQPGAAIEQIRHFLTPLDSHVQVRDDMEAHLQKLISDGEATLVQGERSFAAIPLHAPDTTHALFVAMPEREGSLATTRLIPMTGQAVARINQHIVEGNEAAANEALYEVFDSLRRHPDALQAAEESSQAFVADPLAERLASPAGRRFLESPEAISMLSAFLENETESSLQSWSVGKRAQSLIYFLGESNALVKQWRADLLAALERNEVLPDALLLGNKPQEPLSMTDKIRRLRAENAKVKFPWLHQTGRDADRRVSYLFPAAEGHKRIRAAALSRDGRRVAGFPAWHEFDTRKVGVVHFYGEGARIWDMTTGKTVLLEMRAARTGTSPLPYFLRFSPDGSRIMGGFKRALTVNYTSRGVYYSVRVWDSLSGREIKRLSLGKSDMPMFAFSPDNARLFLGNNKGQGVLFDLASGKKVMSFQAGSELEYAEFSPDGRIILTVFSARGGVKLWDAQTGRDLGSLRPDSYNVVARLSPDGKLIAIGDDEGNVELYETQGLGLFAKLAKPADFFGPVTDIQLSPDGAYLLATSGQHEARLWDVRTQRELSHIRSFDEQMGMRLLNGPQLTALSSQGSLIRQILP